MTENLKNFMAKVSEDPELVARLNATRDAGDLIALAEELGFRLTAQDLNTEPKELDDDDLDAVAGGSDVSCACAMGGGGTKDSNDKACGCVLAGAGYARSGRYRCVCGIAGYGDDT